jgi:hypothetical protein
MATAELPIPILRTSERSTFKKCAWRWLQEYRYGYKPRGSQADALWFGIGIHQALAEWYLKGKRRGPHPADTFAAWVGDEINFARSYLTDTFEEPVWLDARDLGIEMLEGYVDVYGRDPQWQIISVEQPFEIAIRRNRETAVVFKSRWDGVFRDLADGNIYLLETKTASQIATAYLELDDQGGSYWAVAGRVLRVNGVLKKGEEIGGIQYNFLRKAMPDERPVNSQGLRTNNPTREHYIQALRSIGIGTVEQSSPKSGPIPVDKAKLADLQAAASFASLEVLGEVSKSQPPPLFVRPDPIMRNQGEIATQLQRIADEVQWMNAIRSGILPVTKTPTRDCPKCPFWGPCTLHEQGSDSYRTLLSSNYTQEDPYADVKSAAG